MTPTYEREAEDFLADLEGEYYQNGAGLKDTLDLSAIYGTYAHLFDRPRAEGLLAKRESKTDRFLGQFAAFQYLDSSVRSMTEEITNSAIPAATILVDCMVRLFLSIHVRGPEDQPPLSGLPDCTDPPERLDRPACAKPAPTAG